jgi:hypothetical protein
MINTWKIEWIKTTQLNDNPSQFVLQTEWRCTVTDNNVSSSRYGTCQFSLNTYDKSTFVKYSDLTEELVLQWCFNSSVNKTEIQDSLIEEIKRKKNTLGVESLLPWKQQ